MVTPDAAEFHKAGAPFSKWTAMRRGTRGRRVSFAQAMFERRNVLRYAAYRLRYFLFFNFALLCLRLIEPYLLAFESAHSRSLHALLALRLISHLVSDMWWGALDIMRQQIRDSNDPEKPRALAHRLGCWHAAGIMVIGTMLVAGLECTLLALRSTDAGRFVACYAIAILVELSTSLALTLRRSGISAMHRIPRSALSITIAPLVGVCVLFALWPAIGGYALIASSLATSMSGGGIGFYYTQRAYAIHDWPTPIRPTPVEFGSFIKHLRVRDIALAAFAFGSINIENIVLAILSYAFLRQPAAHLSWLFFYVTTRTLGTCNDWARLFYIDFVRFDVQAFSHFMPSLRRRFLLASMGVGGVLWLPTIFFSTGDAFGNEWIGHAALLALFVWRTQFAWLQMAAFCRRLYWPLVAVGALICSACVAVAMSWRDTPYRASISLTVSALCVLLTMTLWDRIQKSSKQKRVINLSVKETTTPSLSYLDWLRAARSSRAGTRIVRIGVSGLTSERQKKVLLETVLPPLTGCDTWTWLDEQSALGLGPGNDSLDLMRVELAKYGGGLITEAKCGATASSGRDALRTAYFDGFFSVREMRGLPADMAAMQDVRGLVSLFAKRFPDGQCFSDGVPDKREGIGVLDTSRIWRHIMRSLLVPAHASARESWDVSVTLDQDGTPVVFCVPLMGSGRSSATRWRLGIYWWNVRQFALL